MTSNLKCTLENPTLASFSPNKTQHRLRQVFLSPSLVACWSFLSWTNPPSIRDGELASVKVELSRTAAASNLARSRTWGWYTQVGTACLHKWCNNVATHSCFMTQSLNPVPPQRAILPLTSDRSVIDAELTCRTRWHHPQFVALDVPHSLMGGPQWPQMVQIP